MSAVTQANEDKRVKTSVTWDPAGPTFDEPKTLRQKRVRHPGCHPLSDFNSDSDVNSEFGYSAPAREAWSSSPSESNDHCRALKAKNSEWTVVGKYSPQPLNLSSYGIGNIFRNLLDVQMVKSARQAVAGEGICIGLNYKTSSFVHPKALRNNELFRMIVDEARSHEELQNIPFASIRVNQNAISASHTDNNLIGTPPIAKRFGRLRRRSPSY